MENKFFLSVQEKDSNIYNHIHRSSKNSFTMKESVHFNTIQPENENSISRNSIILPTKKSEKSLVVRQPFKSKTGMRS
jgi:hypothetical protein